MIMKMVEFKNKNQSKKKMMFKMKQKITHIHLKTKALHSGWTTTVREKILSIII